MREPALQVEQSGANRRDGCDTRGGESCLCGAQLGFIISAQIEILSDVC